MKRWFESKTLWFNIVTLAVTLAGIGLQYVGELGLTTTQQGAAGLGLTIISTLGNMYLRTVTTKAIK